jgi:tripartite-type tricarboxylate transporter receptor subunit TctC
LKGFEANNWNAFYVPAGTPRPVINQLNKTLAGALTAPDIKEFLFKQGLDAAPGTPEELTKYMKTEYAKWGKVIKAAGLKGLEG